MDIRKVSEMAKMEAFKRKQFSGLGGCSACSTQTLPFPSSSFSGVKEWFSDIPWPYIITTAIVSAGLSSFITWKVASSVTRGKVALKLSGLVARKRKKRRKKRKAR